MNESYTVAIDIGHSSVRVAAGRLDANGMLNVKSVATVANCGMRMGRIDNLVEVSTAVSRAVSMVEKSIDAKVERAFCGVSGEFVYMIQHEETIDTDDSGLVRNEDLDKLRELMNCVQPPQNYLILESFVQSLMVDGNRSYKSSSTISRFAHRIGACYNFILCEQDAIRRIDTLFRQCEIEPKCHFANSSIFGDAVVSGELMEGGVAVVDLGACMTNVAIYHSGKLCYSSSIPVGSEAINKDVMQSFKVDSFIAEELKNKYGCSVASADALSLIRVQGRMPNDVQDIFSHNLGLVIEARVTNIVNYLEREIRESGFGDKLAYGVLLCGGGAKLRGVDKVFRRYLTYDVDFADCSLALAKGPGRNKYSGCENATLVGLLLAGISCERDAAMQGEEYAPCTVPFAMQPSLDGVSDDGSDIGVDDGVVRIPRGGEDGSRTVAAARPSRPRGGGGSAAAASQGRLNLGEPITTTPRAEEPKPGQEPINPKPAGKKSGTSIFSKIGDLFSGVGKGFDSALEGGNIDDDHDDEEQHDGAEQRG